jgi:hypothetical protein
LSTQLCGESRHKRCGFDTRLSARTHWKGQLTRRIFV